MNDGVTIVVDGVREKKEERDEARDEARELGCECRTTKENSGLLMGVKIHFG